MLNPPRFMLRVNAQMLAWATLLAMGCHDADPSPKSFRDSSREEIADAFADQICHRGQVCGSYDLSCRIGPSGPEACQATWHDPGELEYDLCFMSERQEFIHGYAEVTLTTELREALFACWSDSAAIPCPTQEDMQVDLAAVQRGDEPPRVRPLPASCVVLNDLVSSPS